MHPSPRFSVLSAAAVLKIAGLTAVLAWPVSRLQAEEPAYNKDIRPILSDNCFNCHGPDSGSRKAGLRLDSFEGAVRANKDGEAAIIPGNPEKSALLARVTSKDPDDVMPPPEFHKEVTPEQAETLRRWIAAGAKYEPHWSFLPPVRTELPAVKDAAWGKNPVDRFVLAELEKTGMSPEPEADRRTLARRLSLDLTGLPPSPEMVEAFLNDPAPDAYEKLADRLMDSAAWGEHRARYWLDYARYADTHGIHFDNYREMWHYREWVTQAFNKNQPFDQFTVEQLAGDLLPDRTLDQQIASGFNRCNITTNEGGAIDEEYRVLYARDRTETTSQVWMGLTTGCAVCHDHKFDPVSQKEFYALSAFFNNTTQRAMDGNVHNTPPVVMVPRHEDRARMEALTGEVAAAKQSLETRKSEAQGEFSTWAAQASPEIFKATAGGEPHTHLMLDETAGTEITVQKAGEAVKLPAAAGVAAEPGPAEGRAFKVTPGTVLEVPEADEFEWNRPFSYGAWVKLPQNGMTGALFGRMDEALNFRGWDLWLQGGAAAAHIISDWQEDAIKVTAKKPLPAGEWQHVFLSYDGSGKAAGMKIFVNGQEQPVNVEADGLKGTIRTPGPLKLGQRHNSSRLDGVALRDVRLYHRKLEPAEVAVLPQAPYLSAVLAKVPEQRTEQERTDLLAWYLPALDGEWQKRTAQVEELEREQEDIRRRSAVTHVMQEMDTPAEAHLLVRGEYSQRGEKVTPGTPAVLPPMPEALPRNRLGLAQWLLLPENPLTARVTVNRFWQEIFGTGLVATAGDFGISGEQPSHPELLDWLAVEFRESGWNMKHMFRLLVTSAAYRQSAVISAEKLAADPANRLLSRGPRFRMDAEMVRDYALAASGLLVSKIGGPSVRPYQPDGIWDAVAMPESNTRIYKADTGEGLYRRSMYTFWKRAAPPASMDIFNAPAREVCTVRRERTNTPLQALATLNDPQFVEAARHLAQRALKECGDAANVRACLNFMAARVLARPLKEEELAILEDSFAELHAYYQNNIPDAEALIATGDSKADPALPRDRLAAWTMIANQVLNLDETLNK